MRPTDLDDAIPPEPSRELLAGVHERSRAFGRRRSLQRLASATSAVIVVALVVAIAFASVDSGKDHVSAPDPSAPTTLPDVGASLQGEWVPLSIAGYDGPLASPPLAHGPTLRFGRKGRWGGSDGCNSIRGTYELGEGGTLHIGEYGGTLAGCMLDGARFDGVPIDVALSETRRLELRDGGLMFVGDDGQEVARFARAGVRVRLEIPTTIAAGSTVSGAVVVENYSGRVLQRTGCGALYFVALGNRAVTQEIATDACLQQYAIPVGETRHPVRVSASLVSCTSGATSTAPKCLPSGVPPPLPPGEYDAIIYESGSPIATAPPVTVQVVAGPDKTSVEPVSEDALLDKWVPVSIVGYRGPLGADTAIRFVPDGSWIGDDGCNSVDGTYRLGDNAAFNFDLISGTKRGCTHRYPGLDSLEATARVVLAGNRLTFLGADGRELAIFERAGVRTRLELPATTIQAGATMNGEVVVTNNTGKPIRMSGCIAAFQVALGNDRIRPNPGNRGCLREFVVPIGESRHPVTVVAFYNSCAPGRATPNIPACLPNAEGPPLPAGEYQALVFPSDNVVPTPSPVNVQVVPKD